MTTMEATRLGIPRWMVLAMPKDVEQIVALANAEYHTPAQQQAAISYYLRELRRTQWDRTPRKPASKPASLRPSKIANTSGYRTNPGAHRTARLKVDIGLRRAIARKGQEAWQILREANSFAR